jgi:hypothetical protein
MAKTKLKRVILYMDVVDVPADLAAGERIAVIRGDGPREDDVMFHATYTGLLPNGDSRWDFVEGDPGSATSPEPTGFE